MDYEQELFAQRAPYLQWLLAQEEDLDKNYGNRQEELEGLGKQIRRLSFSSCLDSVQNVVRDSLESDDTTVYLFVKENGELSWAAPFVMLETFLADEQMVFAYADEDYKGSLKELYDIEDGELVEAALAFSNIEKSIAHLHNCDKKEVGIYRGMPWFKPEFSPDTLASFFYVGSIFAIRGDKLYNAIDRYGKNISLYRLIYEIFMEEVNTIFVDIDEKKCWHDIISKKITHIPIVLYTNDELSDCNELAGLNMLWSKEKVIQKNGCVSIIIPSKDNAQVLETCLISLIKYTQYKNYELIIVDNGSCDEQKKYINDMISKLRQEHATLQIAYLYEKMEFNFSKMCNIGAKAARGEFLLFLNDDIEVINTKEGGKWLNYMLEYGEKIHVGAVGAKLYYPIKQDCEKLFLEGKNSVCYKIQHVGITNMGIGPAHKLGGVKDKDNLYHGHNIVNYNMLAVTAACMLVKKSTFDKRNGFDEELAVAYNDVELCFRLYEAGLYNVQVNDAVLFHHESLSRGQDTSLEKQKRLHEEKEKLYKKHPLLKNRDPFYSPNLVQWKKDVMYSICYQFSYDKPLQPIQSSKQWCLNIKRQYQKYQKYSEKRLGEVRNQHTKCSGLMAKIKFKLNGYDRSMLNIDSIVLEGRLAVIRGWHVLTKYDNACLDRKLWLIRMTQDKDYFKSYVFAFAPQLRQDVAALFDNEEKKSSRKQTKNTMLAGIHLVVDTTELMNGIYMLGVLTMAGKKRFVAFADHVKMLEVDN